MLTSIKIRNFKRIRDVDIPLGKTVVFIGPNNSGKTTALQALALWDVGMRAWNAKREGKSSPKKRPGVTINRRDLISTPVPVANLLWHGLHVRRAKTNGGELGTQNIRIDIAVSGVTCDREWSCGFEFDFTNDESFVCRPLRLSEFENVPVT
jgi:DNA polymerase III delta prime subunit